MEKFYESYFSISQTWLLLYWIVSNCNVTSTYNPAVKSFGVVFQKKDQTQWWKCFGNFLEFYSKILMFLLGYYWGFQGGDLSVKKNVHKFTEISSLPGSYSNAFLTLKRWFLEILHLKIYLTFMASIHIYARSISLLDCCNFYY